MSAARSIGTAGNNMGRLCSVLMLSMLLVGALAAGPDRLPNKFHGTWRGTVGKMWHLALHSGMDNSTVGTTTFVIEGDFTQYLVKYEVEGSDDDVLALRGQRFNYQSRTNFREVRNFTVQLVGMEKILVEDFNKDGTKTSFILDRKDDGTAAKGNCKLTSAERLKATLKKEDCEEEEEVSGDRNG